MERSKIRFGGKFIGDRFYFELTGGALALDFVNTLDERRASPKELLLNYERLLSWAMQSGILTDTDAERLQKYAMHNPRRASHALQQAHSLREFLFGVFSKVIKKEPLDSDEITRLNQWQRRAYSKRRINSNLSWDLADRENNLSRMLWPIVFSAVEILTSREKRLRLRKCSGQTCAWLFMDNSRRQNRRWCDMSVCGNRAKARRHRQRVAGRETANTKQSVRREIGCSRR